jgi:glycyl-tRNA synthetase
MSKPLDFQSIFMALQHFWDKQGCLIWQPYYTQVGAGTMNPATALRVLGPEPWNVGYVEPSVRPDDGRYGENPNRMQLHYQFQVILKPDPGNPQEIYLRSLEAVGIDPNKHDIRFVEDNWEWPAFGAWGLGWEVWLDGQEITQFTYFQQAGGIPLDPVSVELTYGLDRIAIALQRVPGFREIRWNQEIEYGQLNLQSEQEQSKYYFEIADVKRLRQMYDLFESESQAALDNDLVLPAYDYLLKCSHTFNVLDARGAIGVTERQAFFGRMRELASRVAQAYLDQRQRLEYPWLDESGIQAGLKAQEQSRPAIGETSQSSETYPTSAQPFLLEIGTEELPAGELDAALGQLRARVPELLDELRLDHGNIRITGTPRRLVVYIDKLAPRQSDLEQLVKGPPADRAFDAQGQPTKAAEGFARSRGVSVSDLEIREMEAGRYVAAVVRELGRPAPAVLAEAIPDLIGSIRFDKSMRWNRSNVAFSRPIRWLLSIYGDRIVPFEYAGLQSGKSTRGLRFCKPESIAVDSPADYFRVLASQGILLDQGERQSFIKRQVDSLAHEVSGVVADDAALIGEVTNLVEAPGGLRGSFDPSYLELPRQVLISVMKKHQRYFPVEKDGNLLPYFIAVANAPCDGDRGLREELTLQNMDLVIEGNEHVIRARFADAAFFVNEDMKKPLEAYVPRLSTLTFQTDLGSMLDKTQRIQQLVDDLAPLLDLTRKEKAEARRAAELCKADLVTKMVVEMTSLQGVMGRYYALNSGETAAVATAIYEHYLPRFSGDAYPETRPGLAVGIADRLDTLAGLFAAGLAPTGAKDPFAQRRAALGLVGNLIAWNLDFDMRTALAAAAGQLPIAVSKESQSACLTFIAERLRNTLLDEGYPYDVVDAVLAAQGYNPAGAGRAVKQLALWVQREDWNTILPAYARCVRITRALEQRYPVAPEAFIEPEERQLYNALLTAEETKRTPGSVDDFLNAFLPMIPVINRFFDEVLVMTEEATQRENRLGLLQRISALADRVADMSRLEGF